MRVEWTVGLMVDSKVVKMAVMKVVSMAELMVEMKVESRVESRALLRVAWMAGQWVE